MISAASRLLSRLPPQKRIKERIRARSTAMVRQRPSRRTGSILLALPPLCGTGLGSMNTAVSQAPPTALHEVAVEMAVGMPCSTVRRGGRFRHPRERRPCRRMQIDLLGVDDVAVVPVGMEGPPRGAGSPPARPGSWSVRLTSGARRIAEASSRNSATAALRARALELLGARPGRRGSSTSPWPSRLDLRGACSSVMISASVVQRSR